MSIKFDSNAVFRSTAALHNLTRQQSAALPLDSARVRPALRSQVFAASN